MKEIIWTSPATRFIKMNSKYFTKNTKVKIIEPEINDEFITTSIYPALQGTMLDILFSWYSNKNIEFDKYNMVNIIKFEIAGTDKSLIRKWDESGFGVNLKQMQNTDYHNASERELFILAYISSILTTIYRSGLIADSIKHLISSVQDIKNHISEDDFQKLEVLFKRIKDKSNSISENNFIDNPVFGGNLPNGFVMRADGDYYYNGVLGDMKSSKNRKPTRGNINQLIFYHFLNKHTLKLNIDRLEIFNPLWNYTYMINVNDIESTLDFLND